MWRQWLYQTDEEARVFSRKKQFSISIFAAYHNCPTFLLLFPQRVVGGKSTTDHFADTVSLCFVSQLFDSLPCCFGNVEIQPFFLGQDITLFTPEDYRSRKLSSIHGPSARKHTATEAIAPVVETSLVVASGPR